MLPSVFWKLRFGFVLTLLGLAACGNNSSGANAGGSGSGAQASGGGAGEGGSSGAGAEGGVGGEAGTAQGGTGGAGTTVRVASFNVSMYRDSAGALKAELAGDSAQVTRIAEVIQRVRPDIILLNEVDYDAEGEAARLLQENFLGVSQNGQQAIEYPHRYAAPSNTGVHSGFDLDNNGTVTSTAGSRDYGGDAFGYGEFEGQYAMLVLSRYPILRDQIRTFQQLLWKDMSSNEIPPGYYSSDELNVLRLSSKNHIDVPIDVNGTTVHVFGSHPTPPSFDGDEDRNGRRNRDEIRFWNDYLAGESYISDDSGAAGGPPSDAIFFIAGDLNADVNDGDSRPGGIDALLANSRIQDPEPKSNGAAALGSVGVNESHQGDPALDTADFNDNSLGNLRIDYVLPSSNVEVTGSGVFWPTEGEAGHSLADASDHHLVWVDLRL